MASTACFLHHHAVLSCPVAARTSSQRYVLPLKPGISLSSPETNGCPRRRGGSLVMSCRLALTVLIGAAAIGSKVSPADVAYGESGTWFIL
ncbi:hypothetical protein CDL12_29744 [Handroanthus impetiginosus]|uniref:Uncharacterized protein n=1 Tax=Handroanthus impetiginosus TaxID=429701 RepID=A0A2G9FXK0_9LAMI|nr:hypothetical protein CDL12_29744 [Handroanthus impetiginosus]